MLCQQGQKSTDATPAFPAGDEAVLPKTAQFLKEQGRMKYVRPLFRSLARKRKEFAQQVFREARAGYHPIADKMVAADLGLQSNV